MTTFKRFPAFIAVFITTLVLASCASATSTGSAALKTGPGVDTAAKTITLGLLTPITGPVAAPVGIPLALGVKVYFDYLNDQGGIDGYKILFDEKDSMYDPQQQVVQYNAIHNDVAMIADSLGTATTFAIKDLSTQDQMLVTAASLSSALAREKYLILAGTPYRLQTENAFDYVANKLGDKGAKVGIIYQDDDYGQDGLTGYKEAISAYGLTDGAKVAVSPTATDFVAQVAQMKESGAKYVFLATLPTATGKILGTANALGFNPQWILQSPAYSPLLLGSAAKPLLDQHAWVVSQGASWGDTSVPGMKLMLDNVAKYAPSQKPDYEFSFGYVMGIVSAAILKKALDNHDVSRAGLLKAYNSLGAVDVGGLLPALQYGNSPTQHIPSRDSVIYQIDSSKPDTLNPLTPDFSGTAAQASQF